MSSAAKYPSSEPDLVLKPNSMQNRVFVFPLLLLAGAICTIVVVLASLGLLGITDRRSHVTELVVASVGLMAVIPFLLKIARTRTTCFGPIIWRHHGILRAKRQVLVNLDKAAEAHVYRIRSGRYDRYQTIALLFLDADGEVMANGPSLPNFQHRDQQRFCDYLNQYVVVTGVWWLGRSNFIQTSTHPPQPSA